MTNIDFDALKISLASPETMRGWSYGEITKAETINYRTLKPEKDGLFDERIFGPTKDLECYCGKYKRLRYKGIICEKCGVEVTYSRVRRERMGHIELAAPVVHTWYFKRIPSKLPALLNVGLRDIESIIYFAQYLVTDVDEEKRDQIIQKLEADLDAKKKQLQDETDEKSDKMMKQLEEKIKKVKSETDKAEAVDLQISNLDKKTRQEIMHLRERLIHDQTKVEESFSKVSAKINSIQPITVISEAEMHQLKFWGADEMFYAGKGAEVIERALGKIDLDKEIIELKKALQGKSKARRHKAIKRLKIIQGIQAAGISPTWMVLNVLPVIPPELRPMVQLPGGRFATSDLNDLYRRVINRNNRLKNLINLGAPDIILQNEKRMLQESIDSLFESSRKLVRGRRELQSLSDMLKGKQGRFRQNLLGKRVDYSGRSVIVVGPSLKIDQVGIPKEMALELFKPFVLRDLILDGYAPNLKSAKYVLEARGTEVWDILERITKDHPVLLNRAPTLHRQNIQSFYPVLVDGKAITFHPAVVGSFAGDFDGDQMAIHIPLSNMSIKEARERLLTPHNLLKLSTGKPIIDLKQEIALGIFYLTLIKKEEEDSAQTFISPEQVLSGYYNGKLNVHTPIRTRINGVVMVTTAGRILFNQILPEKLQYVNEVVNRDVMRKLIAACFDEYGPDQTVRMIDDFKDYGQKFTTKAGISFSISDFQIPVERDQVIKKAYGKIDEIEQNYQIGLMTKQERHSQIINIWEDVTSDVSEFVMNQVEDNSAVGMMLKSKAFKTNPETIRQVEGMKGLMVDSQGFIKETPITSSILEGFSSFEMFLNMIGGRKSLIDVALLTAEAGYLTRRLVDAAHDLLVREIDCETKEGIYVHEESGVDDWPLIERIEGRTAWKDIKNKSGETLVAAGDLIDPISATKIIEAGIEEIPIRSVLTCETPYGICSKCYGKDLATRKLVEVGEAIGVIAAQSIGEPGTQLTLHSKHRAGIAKKEITQGLPRIEELFEARTPKHSAILTEVSGKVLQIEDKDDEIVIVIEGKDAESNEKIQRRYSVPNAGDIKVKPGDKVNAGDVLTEGQPQLEEVMAIRGTLALQKYLLKEIQTVYKGQGVNINDKHVEVIVRKMSEKVKIQSQSTSNFLPGDYTNIHTFNKENEKLKKENEAPLKGARAILGISKTALLTDSWLSAASFEETANVLASAAINERPQTDYLLGLKENVIIGRLIPTGDRASVERIPIIE